MTAPVSAPGRFITFEGIDGAGKSSHIGALADLLRQQGRAVTVSREPGGSPLAEHLRSLLLTEAMDPLTEALLVFAARRDHLRSVLLPALARGEVVLCDRFTDASFAYQGGGRGLDRKVLQTLEQWVQTDPANDLLREPDLTFWFDIPPAEAARRLAADRAADRFEAQPLAFFERVAAAYAGRAANAPQRFVRIDAAQDRHTVWRQLVAALVRRGWMAIQVAAPGHHGG